MIIKRSELLLQIFSCIRRSFPHNTNIITQDLYLLFLIFYFFLNFFQLLTFHLLAYITLFAIRILLFTLLARDSLFSAKEHKLLWCWQLHHLQSRNSWQYMNCRFKSSSSV